MRASVAALMLTLASCGGGGDGGVPIATVNVAPELVLCRSHRENLHALSTIRTSTRRGLANNKLPDRAGFETGVRVHPGGNRIVFSRERRNNNPNSRELFVSYIDRTQVEARVTSNDDDDRDPCWSADGEQIVFSSNRRGAGHRLWIMATDGSNPDVVFDDGSEQFEPDCFASSIAYSRFDPLAQNPRRTIWIFDTTAGVARPITDGGQGVSSLEAPGDFEPAFSPDGTALLFTRTIDDDRRQLVHLDIATNTITTLGDGLGEDRWPRWSPTGDSIFLARSRPTLGLTGLRLYELDSDGANPISVLPDERFVYPGFDPLPSMPARVATSAPVSVDVLDAIGTTAFGVATIGPLDALRSPDGVPITILSGIFNDREVAGLRLRIPLGVADASQIARIDVSARVALSRIDGDTVLRLTLDNPSESRNDTILERTPATTGLEDYAFSTQSLANVDRDGNLVLTIIGDVPGAGGRIELAIDHVTVDVSTDSPQ